MTQEKNGPFAYALVESANIFFEGLTRLILIATLVIGSSKFGLKGLDLLLWPALVLFFGWLGIKANTLAEDLRPRLNVKGNFAVQMIFAILMAVTLVAGAGVITVTVQAAQGPVKAASVAQCVGSQAGSPVPRAASLTLPAAVAKP